MPDIGDGKDPKKNIFMLDWFDGFFRYSEAETAQLLGVSTRSVYRWKSRRSLPRVAAFALMGLAGARKARLGRWRR